MNEIRPLQKIALTRALLGVCNNLMVLEKLETTTLGRSLSREGVAKLKTVAFYVLGTIALIATVVFLLKTEEPMEYQQQFGTYEASR